MPDPEAPAIMATVSTPTPGPVGPQRDHEPMTFDLRTGPGVLRLLSLPGVGDQSVAAITDAYETWTDLVGTPDWRLAEVLGKGVANRLLPHLERRPDPVAIPEHLQVLSRWDPGYPQQLLKTQRPPMVLWCWGTPPPQASTPMIAIVGTRHPNNFGAAAAALAATRAAELGVGVISGLAVGVDTIASVAAMDAGGKTWVYLGGGHNSMSPDQQTLAARIVATGGGVLAEVAPDIPVAAHLLTARNRLQSGTAHATFIAQTRIPSGAGGVGTMHTVRHTIQQHRLLAVACPDGPSNGNDATAGNYALADPDGIDPDYVYATKDDVRALVTARKPCADIVVHSRTELGALFNPVLALAAQGLIRDPSAEAADEAAANVVPVVYEPVTGVPLVGPFHEDALF